MTTSRLLLRRARAQVGLLALVALLVAVVAATVAGTLAATLGGARDGARDALAAAGPDGALQVSTRLDADDPQGQRAAADDALADALGGRPVAVSRTLRSLSLPVVAGDAEGGRSLVLAAEPDLARVAHVVDGDWPPAATGTAGTTDDPDPAALHAGAADALGVAVGDALVVTSDGGARRVLRVAATWLPDDPDDARWAGEALVATGTGDAVGPAVVDEHVLAAVPGIDLVRWTVVPDLDRVGPADLAPVADGLDRFVADAQASVQSGGLSTSGGLVDTLRRTDAALTAASAVTGAALALVAVVAVVALAQVARLLGAVRATETTVLRSRGTTVGQLTAAAAAEALVVSVPPALVGAGVAAAVVGRDAEPAVVVAATLAVVAAGVATLTLGARAAAARAGDRSDPAGRRSRSVATGGVVLVLLAAGLATSRLVRSSAAAPAADGAAGPTAAAEPAAVAAVPLGVLAVALLAAAALPALTRAVARVVGRRSGLVVPLAARQVARRATVYSVPVVLVTLATATGALAAVHVGTTAEQRRTAAAASAGADVRLVLRDVPPPVADAPPPTEGLDDDAGAGVPVLRATAGSASRVGTLLAVPSDVAGDVVRADGVPGLRDALDALAPAPRWPLPAGATAVRVGADVDGAATAARLWWADADGVLRATTATGADGTWSAPPPGPGAWTVQGVELAVAGGVARQVVVTELVAEGPDGDVDLLGAGPWTVAVPGGEPLVVPADGPDLTLPGTGSAVAVVRVVPGAADPLPLVVSADWAAADGLAVGSPVTVRVDDHPVEAVVASVQPVVPGASGRAALADLRAAGSALLATAPVPPVPTEVWFASDDPPTTARAVRAAADARDRRATVTTVAVAGDDPLTRGAGAALVVAAACALAVALPGVAAAVLALARARRAEVGVLHALGVPPRAQARGRGTETGTVLGLALAVGALGGLLLGAALGPALVRVVATGPAALVVVPTAHPGVLGALLGAAALGCALVALGDGARVRRDAATATVREDAR